VIGWAAHPQPSAVWPDRIAADALGDGLPRRDLLLSPDHAVYTPGRLKPVKYLIDRVSIRSEGRDCVTHFHVELPPRDVIRAEGLPVESYLDIGDRALFVGRIDLARTRGAAPLVIAGSNLDAVRTLI
jgi:hypothetical protein